MRSIRSAGVAVALAGVATIAGTALPAFAAGPQMTVTPSVAAPGALVTFTVFCGAKATSATLFGTTLGMAEHIPMSEESQAESGSFVTTVTLPAGTGAGSYAPSIDCSNGVSGTAALTVRSGKIPVGPPVTGDGVTSTATGGPLTAAGIGLLGLSGALGAAAARRRRG
jgi:hypothetical protein